MSNLVLLWPTPVFLHATIGRAGTDPVPDGHAILEFCRAENPDRVIARNSFEYDEDDSPSDLLSTFNFVLLAEPVTVGLILRPNGILSKAEELHGVLVALLPPEEDGEDGEDEPWRSGTPDWAQGLEPIAGMAEGVRPHRMLTLGQMYRGWRAHPGSLDQELQHWLACILDGKTLPIEDYHLHRALGDLPEGIP